MNGTLSLEGKTVLSIEPFELKSKLKKLVPFMGTDVERAELCGVYFQYSNGELTLCATTGQILCEIKTQIEADEDGECLLTIPSSSVKDIIKVLPKSLEVKAILIKISKNSKEIEFESPNFSYVTSAIDGVFPNYQSRIPVGKHTIRKGLRARYLQTALKALGDLPVDISVDSTESDSPQLITADEAQGIRCVVMPIVS